MIMQVVHRGRAAILACAMNLHHTWQHNDWVDKCFGLANASVANLCTSIKLGAMLPFSQRSRKASPSQVTSFDLESN